MIVAVFGSAQGEPGSEAYTGARALGRMLGEAGLDVMTGGYCGTMEAISRGAFEAGSHTYGVTCADIEVFRPLGVNPWVKTEISTPNLNRRLEVLTRQTDAMIALPGGTGTLVEIMLSLNLMVVKSIPTRPLILIGQEWQSSFSALFENNAAYIRADDQKLVHFARTNEEAVDLCKYLLIRSDYGREKINHTG
ncbi:MAG TPA: LOG family protein [Anaerolineaceae bacterium]|nr:LOG family protein [Anaerolineaceae bacterium]